MFLSRTALALAMTRPKNAFTINLSFLTLLYYKHNVVGQNLENIRSSDTFPNPLHSVTFPSVCLVKVCKN